MGKLSYYDMRMAAVKAAYKALEQQGAAPATQTAEQALEVVKAIYTKQQGGDYSRDTDRLLTFFWWDRCSTRPSTRYREVPTFRRAWDRMKTWPYDKLVRMV